MEYLSGTCSERMFVTQWLRNGDWVAKGWGEGDEGVLYSLFG